MSESDNRNRILNILLRVFENGEFLQTALRSEEAVGLSTEDLRFTENVCRGVIERYEALREIIDKVSSTPLLKMRPQIRCILLSAAYQILYLRTEDYAACNEAVKLTEKRGLYKLKGFVNAILRTISREKESLLSGLSEQARSGLPLFLYDRFSEWFGKEKTEKICFAMSETDHRNLTVRSVQMRNTAEEFENALTAEGISFTSVEGFRDLWELKNAGDPSALRSYREGRFYPQSMGSVLATDIAADLLSVCDDEFAVLDVCSSPGGKILNAYDKAAGKGRFTACDVNSAKTSVILENFSHYHVQNAEVLVRDARVFEPDFYEKFDLVIADLPCSGLGTLSGKPDIRLHVTPESLESIALLQKEILKNIRAYVKHGGTLLFSTCTLNPSENEDNLLSFLEENEEFFPVDFSDLLPSHLRCASVSKGYLTILPGINGNEGFFISRLQRR